MKTTYILRRAALVAAVALAACQGDDPVRLPNASPDTAITASPPQQTPTGALVSLAWEGTDDREVVAFEWRLSDNGPDGSVDEADTLGLPWHLTTAWDTTLVVSADLDSFAGELVGWAVDEEHPVFWQTHTFFLRAIDDYGVRDPEPAMASFTAVSLAPSVVLDDPTYLPFANCGVASRMLTVGWTAEDPDVQGGAPVEVRLLQLRIGGPDDTCYTRAQYEALDPIGKLPPDDPAWGAWIPFDAADPSSFHWTLGPLQSGDKLLLAVQARDAAGAVSPAFEWGANVRQFGVGSDLYPQLRVEEESLWGELRGGIQLMDERTLLEGASLHFRWSADASSYGGRIVGLRHGLHAVDPVDPDDMSWLGAWEEPGGEQSVETGPVVHGEYVFVVECMDDSGTVMRCGCLLHALQVPPRAYRQQLLLVDDWILPDGGVEQLFEAIWDQAWEDLLLRAGLPPARWDTIDLEDDPGQLTMERLLQYKGVVWFCNGNGPSLLHRLSASYDPLNQMGWSWLEEYQRRGGNLLLVGPGVGYDLLKRDPPEWEFPVVFDETPAYRLEASTRSWPYRGFGLSALSLVRPPWESITGEVLPRPKLRSLECDAMMEAAVEPSFAAEGLVTLRPDQYRRILYPVYMFENEEFYDTDASLRGVTIDSRPEMAVMFRLRARRDDPTLNIDLRSCPQSTLERSPLDGAPVGIMSTAYSDTKPWPDTADFLWGFHPLAFELEDVAKALRWIFEENWRLDE